MSDSIIPRVAGWHGYESAMDEKRPENQFVGGMGGWFKPGMRWRDLIKAAPKESAPWFEALRSAVLFSDIRHGGDWHQDSEFSVPMFDGGTVALFTYRCWGDVMAAIWSTQEDRDYSYMDFYMESMVPARYSPDHMPKTYEQRMDEIREAGKAHERGQRTIFLAWLEDSIQAGNLVLPKGVTLSEIESDLLDTEFK